MAISYPTYPTQRCIKIIERCVNIVFPIVSHFCHACGSLRVTSLYWSEDSIDLLYLQIIGTNDFDTTKFLDAGTQVTATWHWPTTNSTSDGTSASKIIGKKINRLQFVLYGCLFMKTPSALPLMQKTNLRIYGRMQVADQLTGSDPISLATNYQQYMDAMPATWSAIVEYVAILANNIRRDMTIAQSLGDTIQAEWDQYNKQLTNIENMYTTSGLDLYDFASGFAWTWISTSKRD